MPDLGSYRLEVEELLTWFPTRHAASLKEVRIRGHVLNYSTQDKFFDESITAGFTIGQSGTDDPIAPGNSVVGFTEVSLDADITFNVECTLMVGARKRAKRMHILPDTRTPFMIIVEAAENDQGLSGTSAVLQGVIVATPRFGESLVVSQIVKLVSSRGP
jgi:hypothetical protein